MPSNLINHLIYVNIYDPTRVEDQPISFNSWKTWEVMRDDPPNVIMTLCFLGVSFAKNFQPLDALFKIRWLDCKCDPEPILQSHTYTW